MDALSVMPGAGGKINAIPSEWSQLSDRIGAIRKTRFEFGAEATPGSARSDERASRT
jgi:hypothetical protein